MKIFDRTLDGLERALDARLLRQNVLAGNIANANTPGFMPKDVDFEAAMASARGGEPGAAASAGAAPSEGTRLPAPGPIPLDAPRPALRALSAGGPAGSLLVNAAGAAPGLDGNAVDLDRTMVAMAQNALQYSAAARAAGKKLAILRYAASDGVG